jgi:hypothetical protein
MTSPVITGGTDHKVAFIYCVRGCENYGNPWDVYATTAKTAASTTMTAPSVTTTVDRCFIVSTAAVALDSAGGRFSSESASGYYSLREYVDIGTTDNAGGVIGVWGGIMEVAGATGTMTATISSSVDNAVSVVAFKPPQLSNTVSVVSPSSGATTPTTSWVVDITGNHAGVAVTQSSVGPELIHDGSNFLGLYSTCSRQAISGGYRYTLARRSGWLTTPTFSAISSRSA